MSKISDSLLLSPNQSTKLYWSLDLPLSFYSAFPTYKLMPPSPIQALSRPGQERLRNALALTARRRAMVCHKSSSFKHRMMTECLLQTCRRPPQHPLLPLFGSPSSKPSTKSSSQKRTSHSSCPTCLMKLHHFYSMMSPKIKLGISPIHRADNL